MISIFLMYSADRLPQLKTTMFCLEHMDRYEECQKILVVDGETNIRPDGWDVIEVPRLRGKFNWSSMWRAGVDASAHDKVLYLDSDRVLPTDYLARIDAELKDDVVLFCGSLFNFKEYQDPEDVIALRDVSLDEIRDGWDKYKIMFDYDPRWLLPIDGPGKGPCSGNTAFTKATFLKSGGVDPWFEGHGAYADTDFHKQLWEMGVKFVDMDVPEFHLKHPKMGDENEELTMRDIEVLSLNNFIYHCKKWNLGYKYPRTIASWLNLPGDFVDRVLLHIDEDNGMLPIWT